MIVVIGEALIDLIQDENQPSNFRGVVGGANSNVALALARRDSPHQFLARISGDIFGKQIKKHLLDNAVAIDYAIDASEQSTLAFATIDSAGTAKYAFYVNGTADWAWRAEELPTSQALQQMHATTIQFGCLAMEMAPGNAVIEHWLAGLHESRQFTLSHDINVRPALGFDSLLERIRVEKLNRLSTIIKASDADIEWLYSLEPDADVDGIVRDWIAGTNKIAIITRGASGCDLYRGESKLSIPGIKVDVQDTVGAGDTFMANFLTQLDQLGGLGTDPQKRLERLDDDDLAEACKIASVAAAIACERSGAEPPTTKELAARLGS